MIPPILNEIGGMASILFHAKNLVGQWFEDRVREVLIAKGCIVLDSRKLPYQKKKQWDLYVEVNGGKSPVECKYQEATPQTGNVWIDHKSLLGDTAPIWIMGWKTHGKLAMYSMLATDLRELINKKYPVILGGEWKEPATKISVWEFVEARNSAGKKIVHLFEAVDLNALQPEDTKKEQLIF